MTAPRPRKSRSSSPTRSRKSELIGEPAPSTNITLITGTDTGVGKTWVGCALARALLAAGQRVVAIKPIETGCGPELSLQEDGVLLAGATGQREPTAALVRLREPLAAAVAAEMEGRTIDLQALVERIRGYAASHDVTLVEGTGGLLAPLTWNDNMLDLAHGLDAKVLVVASDRLGTLNHTLLTIRILRAERVPVIGVVLTTPDEPDASTRSNADAIRRLSGIDLVWPVPRLPDPEQAAEALKEVAGWLLP
jgi:dethiobiotin synthetase